MTRCNRENVNYVVFILFHFFGLLSSREAPKMIKVKVSTKGEMLRHWPMQGSGRDGLAQSCSFPSKWCSGTRSRALPTRDTGPGHHPQVRRGQLARPATSGKDNTGGSELSGRT